MANILVTGGAGFIGSHLTQALLDRGHFVRILDNLSSGKPENIPLHKNVEIRYGSVNDRIDLHYACRDIEYVFHEAAIPSVPLSISDPFSTQTAGEIGTLCLLDEAAKAKAKRVIFAASSSAYGNAPAPQSESMPPGPLSPYAASKLACEHYMRAFAACKRVDTISLRYFNVFGPRQDPNSPYSGVISIFLKKMKNGESPTIYGDGSQRRDFVYVENVVAANLLAMQIPKGRGEVVNIGCGKSITINELVKAVNNALNTSIEPTYAPARAGEVFSSEADISKAKDMLGYLPTISFEDGIRRMV